MTETGTLRRCPFVVEHPGPPESVFGSFFLFLDPVPFLYVLPPVLSFRFRSSYFTSSGPPPDPLLLRVSLGPTILRYPSVQGPEVRGSKVQTGPGTRVGSCRVGSPSFQERSIRTGRGPTPSQSLSFLWSSRGLGGRRRDTSWSGRGQTTVDCRVGRRTSEVPDSESLTALDG